MERTLRFNSHPTEKELADAAAAYGLQGPFSVEIRQGWTLGMDLNAPPFGHYQYHEFVDCDTIYELHEFITSGEYAVNNHEDFVVVIEEMELDEERDHPSLTAAERNPSMIR